jgi:hypothetical protein
MDACKLQHGDRYGQTRLSSPAPAAMQWSPNQT